MKLTLKIGFVFFGVCSLAFSIIYARYYALPHPHDANRNQLGYWLVLKNLEHEPVETRIALIDWLVDETELITASDQSTKLSDSQTSRLASNICVLKNCWFLDRVEQHHHLTDEKQWHFLCNQIEVVNRWVTLMTENPEFFSLCDGSEPAGTPAQVFFGEIDQWIADAPSEKRDIAVAAVNHSVYVWLSVESLENQSIETRCELADRIVYELRRGLKIENKTKLSPEEQKMLNANGILLVEAWMYKIADELAIIQDKRKRLEFVDQLIADFQSWGILEALQNGESESVNQPSMMENMLKFTKLIERWIARAEPERQKNLEEFYRLAKSRIMAAVFSGTLFKRP